MSERLVGAIVAIHGDEKGLIMPPSVAPVQVVVIPVLTKDAKDEPTAAAKAMTEELKAKGLRAEADLRHRPARHGRQEYAPAREDARGGSPGARVPARAAGCQGQPGDCRFGQGCPLDRGGQGTPGGFPSRLVRRRSLRKKD